MLPSPGQRAAVGHGRNIRALNVHTDPDDVIRRVPLRFEVDGEPVPSMAAELAAARRREPSAGGASPRGAPQSPNTITLNFEGGADDIPTYSLADLRACADEGRQGILPPRFRRQGRADRHLARRRGSQDHVQALRDRAGGRAGGALRAAACRGRRQKFTRDFDRRRLCPRHRGQQPAFAATLWSSSAASAIGHRSRSRWRRSPRWPRSRSVPPRRRWPRLDWRAAWTAGATVAFRSALALPLIEPVARRARRARRDHRLSLRRRRQGQALLRQSFALYLAPAVIDKMLTSNKPPALGGEMRNVTVYFSDIADFSSIAEKIPPAELVAAMNEYLSAMTDIIEAHGGFVDKYIGDAIVAVFGAPLDDPRSRRQRGARGAACTARLAGARPRARRIRRHALRQRIGLNSGEALVGNIGSRRRFNYTVMGDMVNLASRLEGANKLFGTTIIASETTVALTGRRLRLARARRDPRQGPRPARSRSSSRSAQPAGRAGAGVARARPTRRASRAIARATLPAPPHNSRASPSDPPATLFLSGRAKPGAKPARRRTGNRSTRWTRSSADAVLWRKRHQPWLSPVLFFFAVIDTGLFAPQLHVLRTMADLLFGCWRLF